jgi:hypothetical protein
MCFWHRKLPKSDIDSVCWDDIPVFVKSWEEVWTELANLGLVAMVAFRDMPDSYMYHTNLSNWETIFRYLTYSAEYYVSGRCDCDDYSKKASADSSFYLGLNVIQDWGNTPLGYHAFNMVRTVEGWKIFEPNAGFVCAGELMDIKNNYKWEPVKWKP